MFVYLNQELATVSVELPDVLKSLQLCKLKENEVIFLKDIKKTLTKPYVMKQQVNILCHLACVNYRSIIFGLIKSLVIAHLVLHVVLGHLSHSSMNVIFQCFFTVNVRKISK